VRSRIATTTPCGAEFARVPGDPEVVFAAAPDPALIAHRTFGTFGRIARRAVILIGGVGTAWVLGAMLHSSAADAAITPGLPSLAAIGGSSQPLQNLTSTLATTVTSTVTGAIPSTVTGAITSTVNTVNTTAAARTQPAPSNPSNPSNPSAPVPNGPAAGTLLDGALANVPVAGTLVDTTLANLPVGTIIDTVTNTPLGVVVANTPLGPVITPLATTLTNTVQNLTTTVDTVVTSVSNIATTTVQSVVTRVVDTVDDTVITPVETLIPATEPVLTPVQSLLTANPLGGVISPSPAPIRSGPPAASTLTGSQPVAPVEAEVSGVNPDATVLAMPAALSRPTGSVPSSSPAGSPWRVPGIPPGAPLGGLPIGPPDAGDSTGGPGGSVGLSNVVLPGSSRTGSRLALRSPIDDRSAVPRLVADDPSFAPD
jgi:hypothetical protein